MKLIDCEAAAFMLGCSPRHIRNLVATGVLPNRGKPKKIRLYPSDISSALESGTVTPRPRATRRR